MSGDVQPRKRKDKKKRKDEGDVPSNEDVNIHVHKDGGTGGNICAKVVFFFLFSALIVLIGLIIKENQGLNELDNTEADSRFSQIFEGWVDKAPAEHEEEHSPELQDHDEVDDHEGDLDEEPGSEESNLDEDTEEDQSQEVEEDGEDEEEQELEDDDDSALRSEEDELNEDTDEELYHSQENDEEDEQDTDGNSDERTEEIGDIAEDEADNQEDEESNEQEDSSEQVKRDDDNDVDDDDESKETSAAVEESEETKHASDEVVEPEVNGETKEEVLSKEQSDTVAEPQEPGPKSSKESSGLATKIGVGVALLTVAYNVFLRKRRSDVFEKPTATKKLEEKDVTPDLSRRNTIVPPPSLQEVEPDLPDIEVEDEEYSEDDYSDEDSRSEHRSARDEYQDLRKTYTRSMTPEGEFDAQDKSFEEDVLDDEIEKEEEEEELEAEEDLEEEEIDDDYDKYDEDEDEELLKRLEAKYGKLGREVNVGDILESDSDVEDYEHSDITNKDDYTIREDIDAAQQQLDKNAAYANKMFEALLDKFPLSPRLLYGKARALDLLAEKKKSNDLLKQSLSYYIRALNSPDIPDQLFVTIAERYIDRARFMGQYKKAIAAHWQLIERFPDNATYLNNLAVTYLTINLVEEARSTLKRVLSKWPNDGFALVHYGFILKTADNDLKDSIAYMTRGLNTKAPGVIDGRFYFHLGDALTRLNRIEEAVKLYEEGVEQKVFMSKYQRSLYNVARLTAKPWWDPKDIPSYQTLFSALKENWRQIKQEGLSALNDQGYFQDEAENLKDTGTWKQLELFARGQKSSKNCARSPVTCNIIQKFADASGCRRGQSKFSVMHPGTHVWPHCGPTNCRLRIHLGLKVPLNTFIRVAEDTRSWKEGDIIIFDDSFEHEVWHNGTEFRLVLIVDVWHPNLTPTEKKSLPSI